MRLKTGHGDNCLPAALDLLLDCRFRTGSGNAVDGNGLVHRWHMVFAVVFNLEQIRMRHHYGKRFAIVLQPAGSDKDRRRYLFLHQRIENAMVGLAHAGVQSHRHPHPAVMPRRHFQRRLDETRPREGGRGERQEESGKGQATQHFSVSEG
ncbi:hypothetical protein D3C87_1611940 [compost metagenome]